MQHVCQRKSNTGFTKFTVRKDTAVCIFEYLILIEGFYKISFNLSLHHPQLVGIFYSCEYFLFHLCIVLLVNTNTTTQKNTPHQPPHNSLMS